MKCIAVYIHAFSFFLKKAVSLSPFPDQIVFHETLVVRCRRAALAFLVMSEASKGVVTRADYTNAGPDYFGYYTRQVVELLSQEDDLLPLGSETSNLSGSEYGEFIGDDTTKPGKNTSGSLFSNSIGAGLPDFKQERLKALLRQGVSVLSHEVDEACGVPTSFFAYTWVNGKALAT